MRHLGFSIAETLAQGVPCWSFQQKQQDLKDSSPCCCRIRTHGWNSVREISAVAEDNMRCTALCCPFTASDELNSFTKARTLYGTYLVSLLEAGSPCHEPISPAFCLRIAGEAVKRVSSKSSKFNIATTRSLPKALHPCSTPWRTLLPLSQPFRFSGLHGPGFPPSCVTLSPFTAVSNLRKLISKRQSISLA